MDKHSSLPSLPNRDRKPIILSLLLRLGGASTLAGQTTGVVASGQSPGPEAPPREPLGKVVAKRQWILEHLLSCWRSSWLRRGRRRGKTVYPGLEAAGNNNNKNNKDDDDTSS